MIIHTPSSYANVNLAQDGFRILFLYLYDLSVPLELHLIHSSKKVSSTCSGWLDDLLREVYDVFFNVSFPASIANHRS